MITKEDIRKLNKHYPARAHNNKGYDIGFGFIHYAYIRNLKPKRILCVGSQRGFIPAICGLACRDAKEGQVHFVDAGYDCKIEKEHDKSWGGIGVWREADRSYWKHLGLEDYIKIHCMTTKEFEKSLEPFVGFGYIYIDGDHSYEGVKRDYELFYPYLEDGGLMAFHDIDVGGETTWGECGVKTFWKEIKTSKLEILKEAGLGIIQK
jgi:hypothetical protein